MSSTPTPERPASRRGPFWSLFPEVEAAFGLLSTGWAPLGVQGRAVAAEWPDRLISVGELRARLLHPACPYPTRDRVLNTVLDLLAPRATRGCWSWSGCCCPGCGVLPGRCCWPIPDSPRIWKPKCSPVC